MFFVAFITKRLRANRAFWAVCLGLTLILFALPSYALTVQEVPNPHQDKDSWVSDMAQILSPDTEATLNQLLSELNSQTDDEITVVTVPETSPTPSAKAFATKLFNSWDLGRKGVLFLVSKSDRRVEIETGYAIESLLSGSQLSNIIQKEINPQFKQGNLEGGILAGIKSIVVKLGGNLATLQNLAVDTTTTANSNQQSGFVALGILGIGLLVVPSILYFSSIGRRSTFIDSSGSGELGGGESGGSSAGGN